MQKAGVSKGHLLFLYSFACGELPPVGSFAPSKKGGCSGYHPRMLHKLLVYVYLSNQYSSRKIEPAARQNIYLMWLGAMSNAEEIYSGSLQLVCPDQ